MKKAILTLGVVGLVFSASPALAKDSIASGIQNKFTNFLSCYAGIEANCHQFDYNNDGIVGFTDFGAFLVKHSKMIK